MQPTASLVADACRHREGPTVSIYLHAIHDHDARHRIAGLINQAERDLTARGARPQDLALLIEPIRRRLEHPAFWSGPGDRVVFAAPGFCRDAAVAAQVVDQAVVGDVPFVRPLLAPQATSPVLVLTLHADHVRLSVADGGALAAAPIRLPTRTEAEASDLMRDDIPATAVTAPRNHPRGSGDDANRETRAYFHLVANTLRAARPTGCERILLAGTARNVALFRAVAGRLAVLEPSLEIDPEQLDRKEFARRAMELAGAAAAATSEATVDRLLRSGHGAQGEVASIVEAAEGGQVEALLVARDAHAWGRPWLGGEVRDHHGERDRADEDLINRAAVETIRHGGVAYEVCPARLPAGGKALAVLRWGADRYAASAAR